MKNIQTKYKLNFKTMKKGLLTVLAASVVFVGCQNYDDQFDDLNAQISALKSQVDGLSSLSGQVASISGTIAGLQSGIAAAQASAAAANTAASAIDLSGLSSSLTTLQAEVDAIQASLASTATASEVSALQTKLDAVQADLDDLLVSNNVYSTAITVNSAATMASALALGNKVALMNAAVDITDNAAIADTDIQTFVNRIKTMNAALTYSSGSTTGFTPTFDELTSAKDMTLTMAGDISFKKLASAGTIEIHDDYETKITSVDFGAMTSADGLTTDEAGTDATNTVRLNSVTNLDLGAMTRYGTALTIHIKKGGTLDIASLNDINAAGTAVEAITLAITGPDSVTLSQIDDGTITLTDVNTANISNFYGTLDIKTGVKTLTTTKSVFVDLDTATNLETATLNMVNDYDPALTTANAALAAAGNSSTYTGNLNSIAAAALKTLTLTGNWLDLTLDSGESNLETLSIDGDFDDLSINGTTDLTSLTVSSGSSMQDVTLTATTNLAVADFDHSFSGSAHGTTAATSSSVSITDNTALTTLHWAADDVGTLTVTGNDALTAIDFTGLADDGGDTTPAANVYDNNLTAVAANNTSDGDVDKASGLATDLGNFDDGTSGMDSLKTYLTHVVADADFAGYVSFDTVSTANDTETAGTTTTTLNVLYTNATTWNDATVLYEVAAVTATSGGAATKAKRAYLLDISAITQAQFTANGQDVLDIDGDGVPALYIFTGQTASTVIAQLNDADNKALATANGVTMNAAAGGNSTLAIHVGSQLDSAKWETSAAAITNLHLTASDVISLTVGNQTVTLTAASSNTTYEIYSVAKSVGAAIATRWAAVNTGASATIFNFGTAAQASSTINAASGHMLTFTARDKGTGGAGLSASLSIAALDSTGNNGTLPVAYGATNLTSDNTSTGPDVVLTFEANTAGVTENVIGLPATSATSGTFSAATLSHAATGIAGISELHSNYKVNAQTGSVTSTDGHHDESWSDVRYPEDNNLTTTTTTAAVAKTRIAWLG
jgi:hypothetical protein